MQIYNSVIVPIVQYGTESLPLLDKHRSKFTAVEMKYLRRTAGKTGRDRIRNDRIREDLNQKKTLADIIEERQLKWFGHVYRMPGERKPKQAMEMRRGRPRIKWEPYKGKRGKGRLRRKWVDILIAGAEKQWSREGKDRKKRKELPEKEQLNVLN